MTDGFNPRTREACDPSLPVSTCNKYEFQSTHAGSVRRLLLLLLQPVPRVSIHARGKRATFPALLGRGWRV